MHPLLGHKLACVVLLSGLSIALAAPLFDDDNLFAFGPSDGLNTFNSDLFPIDGDASVPSFDDIPSDATSFLDFSDGAFPGFDSSTDFDIGSVLGDGFDGGNNLAEVTCLYGEALAKPGTASHPGCNGGRLSGCARPGGVVHPFDSRLALLCAPANLKCCDYASGPDTLAQCDQVAIPESWTDQVGGFLHNLNIFGGNAGSGAGAGAGVGGGAIFGTPKQKRDGDFCAADFS